MILEGHSDIITRCEFVSDGPHAPSQWLTFRNGFVLVIGESFMSLYKNIESIGDPLGNGLKASVDVSGDQALSYTEKGFVTHYAAGFVGLVDDKAILITPNDIQLFLNKTDALHNRDEIARLKLAD